MTGIDTNVLLRYIVRDDATQTPKADKLLDGFTKERPGFICTVALAEVAWALRSNYRMPKKNLIECLEALLRSRNLVLENEPVVRLGLDLYRNSKADFADCVIERTCRFAGCKRTVTFDEDAAKSAGMELL